jgi:HK97 family phage major capsid protein
MNLQEIRTMRQTCRAKLEDLIGRTSSREMSTEENQMFNDLKAEGERLGSLESRYAVLEGFDKGVTQPINRQPITLTGADRTQAIVKALDGLLRTGKMATDTPLQILESPISGAAAAVPTDVVPTIVQGINDFDIPGRLGVTDYPRDSSVPLVVTVQSSAPASTLFVEGAAPSSSTPPTYKTLTLHGSRYANLTKYSLESRMNLGIPIVASVLKALALGQIQAQNSAFMSAFLAAVQANSAATFIQSGSSSSENPDDYYSAVSALKYGLPYFWQNSPNLKWLLSPTDLEKIKNVRSTQNVPLFNDVDDTILGKPYVVHPDATRVFYGDYSVGCFRSRTPLYIQTFLELYAQEGLVGVQSYQWVDWQFYAGDTNAPTVYSPIVYTNLEGSGA